jgi:hypothetical protein
VQANHTIATFNEFVKSPFTANIQAQPLRTSSASAQAVR